MMFCSRGKRKRALCTPLLDTYENRTREAGVFNSPPQRGQKRLQKARENADSSEHPCPGLISSNPRCFSSAEQPETGTPGDQQRTLDELSPFRVGISGA